MFETFEQIPAGDYPRTTETSSHVDENLATSCPEVAEDFCETITQEFTVTEINWLKRIEAILRNGMPTSDKGAAETIGHAYSEVQLLLESIDEDWCMK